MPKLTARFWRSRRVYQEAIVTLDVPQATIDELNGDTRGAMKEVYDEMNLSDRIPWTTEDADTQDEDLCGGAGGNPQLAADDTPTTSSLSPYALHRLGKRERDTVLAALRFWQRVGCKQHPLFEDIISTDSGTQNPLSATEIDDLAERINR